MFEISKISNTCILCEYPSSWFFLFRSNKFRHILYSYLKAVFLFKSRHIRMVFISTNNMSICFSHIVKRILSKLDISGDSSRDTNKMLLHLTFLLNNNFYSKFLCHCNHKYIFTYFLIIMASERSQNSAYICTYF